MVTEFNGKPVVIKITGRHSKRDDDGIPRTIYRYTMFDAVTSKVIGRVYTHPDKRRKQAILRVLGNYKGTLNIDVSRVKETQYPTMPDKEVSHE